MTIRCADCDIYLISTCAKSLLKILVLNESLMQLGICCASYPLEKEREGKTLRYLSMLPAVLVSSVKIMKDQVCSLQLLRCVLACVGYVA